LNSLKKIIASVRVNGCHHLDQSLSIRHAVYTNIIWLTAYTTFVIHSSIIALFTATYLLDYLLITLSIHLTYIGCFLLIKYNYLKTAKHLLILCTYVSIAIFDHLTSKETFTYLYLLAFLPSAMNIFTLNRKNTINITIYLLFPLLYILLTKFSSYEYPHFIVLTPSTTQFVSSLTIVLAFTLFLLFAGYMILNNIAKQKRLLVQSIGLQATLDNSEASIWSIDENFTLTAANIKYIQSIKTEFGEADLKPGVNLKNHPLWTKLPESFKQQYYSALSGKDLVCETELNGRNYEIKGVPIYDAKNIIHGATFGSRDITAEKRAEAALLKAKKTAEEASNAKARFLSNMSHEIRTPLNGIIGITRIMQDEKILPGQISNFKTLQDLSEHTLQIVNNILDFAKIEAGKASLECKRFSLRRFIDKINSIFSATAQLKGIKFIVEVQSQADIYVKGDEVRLSQVLINLIGNAIKFTEEGSVKLKVSITDLPDSAFYTIRFEVSDTGIGIKNENMDKIFESFSQADSDTTRRFGGTGLGLSIADKIITLMNSRLNVKSEHNKGTTFSFDIELSKSSFIHTKNQISIFHNSTVRLNINILLAEDNKINQLVASRILQKWQSKVTIASNGREAADYVLTNKFDVVLMDLDMPVMDGYESISIIKNSFPEVPVIALTAASFDDMNNYLLNKGFCEVVQKPFVPEELYNKIVSAIKKG
jgi:signal transduction histidine kinase/CheY-like chemotaxis protein